MSDEPDAPTTRTGVGLYTHYCRQPGCGKWGGFGFAIGKEEPKWYCFEHRPEVWPPAKRAA